MNVSLDHLVVPVGGEASLANTPAGIAATPLEREMAAFYRAFDREIAAEKPACTNRGTCCRFREYGHDLYVTDVELAYFLGGVDAKTVAPGDERCPYQVEGLCTARDRRPLGCRVFYCDPNAQSWQPNLYESGLRKLKDIGGRLGIPYRYREWLSALTFPDC